MNKMNKAFTLAEVLITLLVIGIVASLVIPAIINDSKEAEYNVGVKKAYADLSNALRMIQVNNGGSVNVGNIDHSALRNEFCNVMSCVKTETTSSIFPNNYKFYKGGYINWPGNSNTSPAALLNNGYIIRFISYSGCTTNGVSACGYINIDLNGLKGPNVWGQDAHSFYIIRQNDNGVYTVLPFGIKGDTVFGLPGGCQSGSTGWGSSEGCTAKRLADPDHMP